MDRKNLAPYPRLLIYSYLPTETLVHKALVLSKYERAMIRRSQIANNARALEIRGVASHMAALDVA